MSADQENANVQYRYGLCLFSGSVVEQKKPEAARFLKMSADNGNAGAEHMLRTCFVGDGVGQNKHLTPVHYSHKIH